MKVVLTGGAGFLGRAVAAALAPDHKVYSLSRRGLAPRGAQGLVGDILDVDSLARGFDGARVVVHLAGQVSHSQAMGARLMKIHVDGTENVVAAARLAGVQRLIHMSTSGTVAVSSRADFMGTEESRRPLQLISRWGYYRSKLFAEEAALSANGADLEVISLNPSLLLGPGDDVEGESTRSVRLFLDERGRVAEARPEACPALLREAALTAAYATRFSPLRDAAGAAYRAQFVIHYRFVRPSP